MEPKLSRKEENSIWKKIEKTASCWMWKGSTSHGYGNKMFRGKCWFAHRLIYTILKGEIPSGLNVCHICDVKLCVNPDHFFLGTDKDNQQDRRRKGR